MTWWHYLLLANVYLTLFFTFYAMFLRKETFFNLNRLYLVSSALLSFFIPLIQATWIQNLFITQRVQKTINDGAPAVMSHFDISAMPVHQLTLGQILGGIYIIGIVVLTFRFVYQLALINWVMHQPQSDTSYSFFNQIKIEERDTDNDVISAHERVHARQWHSVDVLLLEAIMIINWFNPVVYLYRNAVKYIHEFIADRDALKTGTDKAEYAMLLLSQTFITPPYHLVNPFFNSSLLKQRIQMLHKNRSHWVMLVKYGLSAPLFMLMLVLSSATVDKSKTFQVVNNAASNMFKKTATFSQGDLSPLDEADLAEVIKEHKLTASTAPVNPPVIPLSPSNKVWTQVEKSAGFPGGLEGFFSYLIGNIHYPAKARQNNVQGKVMCSFIVEKNGSLSNIKVLRSIGYGADEEAIRVLSTMPRWQPGIQAGMAVRQQYTVPISFTLTDKVAAVSNNDIADPDDNTENFAALNDRVADTTRMEAHFASAVKTQPLSLMADAKVSNTVLAAKPVPQNAKGVNGLKEKAVKNIIGEKATNGIVSIVTKHKSFFDSDLLSY